MNKICITGRAVDRPELKSTTSGVSVCSLTLAVKRPFVNDVTDFVPVVAWRSQAEYLCKYTNKGDVIAVTGMLVSRKWENKEGKKMTSWEVQCESVENLTPKSNGAKEEKTDSIPEEEFFTDVKDVDDLPF